MAFAALLAINMRREGEISQKESVYILIEILTPLSQMYNGKGSL